MPLDLRAIRENKWVLRNQWAYEHAAQGIREVWNQTVAIGHPEVAFDPEKDLPVDPIEKFVGGPWGDIIPNPKVGIIGAGAAGLFTALILDYLNETLTNGFHVGYDIFEAHPSSRVGGRLFTYNFEGYPQGRHDYYDVGAMRFPDNPVMKRIFQLFELLGMRKFDSVDPGPNGPNIGDLIPYYLENESGEPWYFNDIQKFGSYAQIVEQSPNSDPFQLNTDGSIDPRVFQYSPGDVMNASIEVLRERLKEDLETDPPGSSGWDLLMQYDTFSTRQYLSTNTNQPPNKIPPPPYNYSTIEWMETFNGGTDWYDQAHSETVLESLDFEWGGDINWYCILGGAQRLAERMQQKVVNKPSYETVVTAIRAVNYNEMQIEYKGANGGTGKETYAGVFNSTTLGCLRRVDTSQAGLNYATKQAVRSLGYGASAKIAIKFRRPWWIHDLGQYSIPKGGLGHSDLNIRTCVYPSYNIADPANEPAVLLCSYTWQQDGNRISALITNGLDDPGRSDELKQLLIRELALLHQNPDKSYDDVYKIIENDWLDYHAYNWYADPRTAGAFAFFRPQQFSSMWNKLIHPSGDLVLIGEAASPHHAWVVGALESAVHGLHAWLFLNQSRIIGADEALRLLETSEVGNPFRGLPPYMDPTISKYHAFLAGVTREATLTGESKLIGSLLGNLGLGKKDPASIVTNLSII